MHVPLIDFIHLDCHLPVSIHCEDASNLPLVVLVTHLEDVLFKHFEVFSKLNDLVQIRWILNLAFGLQWCVDIIFLGEKRKGQRVLSPFCIKGLYYWTSKRQCNRWSLANWCRDVFKYFSRDSGCYIFNNILIY
jgi:hypothetical protein